MFSLSHLGVLLPTYFECIMRMSHYRQFSAFKGFKAVQKKKKSTRSRRKINYVQLRLDVTWKNGSW